MEHKTKKCPHCGSNIDFLATTCSYCGKDVELSSKAIDKQQIVDNILNDTNKLKSLKPASVFDLFLKNLILVLLLSLPIAFIAAFTDSFVGKLFAVIFPGTILILFIISKLSSFKQKLSSFINKQINDINLSFVKNHNLYSLYYSNNQEIKDLSKSFSQKITEVKQTIKTNSRKALIISSILFVILNLYVFFISVDEKVDYETNQFYPQATFFNGDLNNYYKTYNNVYNFIYKEKVQGSDTFYSVRIDLNLLSIKKDSLSDISNNGLTLTFVDNNKEKIKNMPVLKYNKTVSSEDANTITSSLGFYYEFVNKEEKIKFEQDVSNNPNFVIFPMLP